VLAREFAIHGGYLAQVSVAGVSRREHPGEDDAGAAGLRAADDLAQVPARLGDGLAAQVVVGAEFDDDEAHVAGERPVEAAQAAGRSVARNPRVNYLVLVSVSIQLLLEQRRVVLARVGEAVAGRQAVAERDDFR
jgi:hypothetical protein